MTIRRILETAFYPLAFIACVGIAMLINAFCPAISDVGHRTCPQILLAAVGTSVGTEGSRSVQNGAK
jgi:hypothetical protein